MAIEKYKEVNKTKSSLDALVKYVSNIIKRNTCTCLYYNYNTTVMFYKMYSLTVVMHGYSNETVMLENITWIKQDTIFVASKALS